MVDLGTESIEIGCLFGNLCWPNGITTSAGCNHTFLAMHIAHKAHDDHASGIFGNGICIAYAINSKLTQEKQCSELLIGEFWFYLGRHCGGEYYVWHWFKQQSLV